MTLQNYVRSCVSGVHFSHGTAFFHCEERCYQKTFQASIDNCGHFNEVSFQAYNTRRGKDCFIFFQICFQPYYSVKMDEAHTTLQSLSHIQLKIHQNTPLSFLLSLL